MEGEKRNSPENMHHIHYLYLGWVDGWVVTVTAVVKRKRLAGT